MERCKSLGSLKLLCASALWGQCFVRSHPESLQGASLEWGFSGWWLDGRHPGSSLNSLRAHIRGGCNVMAWWLQYPLFTDLARNIFHSKWLWNRLSLVVRGSSGHMPMNHRSFYYTLPYDQICKPWFKLQISTYPLLLVLDSCWNR